MFRSSAADLDVDRRGHALIEHGVHQAARLKIRAQLGSSRAIRSRTDGHIDKAADLVVFLQAHLNESGVHSGVGREQRGKIGHDADIGNDGFQFAGRDHLPHDIFDSAHIIVGQLDARARGSLEVDHELAGIGAREEGQAHERNQEETSGEEHQEASTTCHGRSRALRTHLS